MVHLLKDHNDLNISASDVSQVLVPPTEEWFDCECILTTNCVKCYSCSGASFADRLTLRAAISFAIMHNMAIRVKLVFNFIQEYIEVSHSIHPPSVSGNAMLLSVSINYTTLSQ